MEKHSPLTLPQILDKLARILALKQTGTFFIATDANTSCRFAIDSGKLTHCAHKRDQGIAAIHSLLETGGGSCSFSENQSIPFRPEATLPHPIGLALLGIQPVIPPRIEPTATTEPVAVEPATLPASNRIFRRGFIPGTTPAPLPGSAPVEEYRPATDTGKKRFYRGR